MVKQVVTRGKRRNPRSTLYQGAARQDGTPLIRPFQGDLSAALAAITSALGTLESDLSSLESEVDAVAGQVNTIAGQIETITGVLDGLDAELYALSSTVQGLDSELYALESAFGDHVVTFEDHHARHEDGGADELAVTALGGYPADATVFLRGDGTFDQPRLIDQTTTATGQEDDMDLAGPMTWLRVNNATPLQITGFQVDANPPTAGDVVIIDNIGDSTVQVVGLSTASLAVNRVITESVTGQILGPGGRAQVIYDGAVERWRLSLVSPGALIDVPFSAGNFSGTESMTWTVDMVDVRSYAYQQIGRVLRVVVSVFETTVGGSPSFDLLLALPAGFVSTYQVIDTTFVADNGVGTPGLFIVLANEGLLRFRILTGSNWQLTTNLAGVAANSTLIIN